MTAARGHGRALRVAVLAVACSAAATASAREPTQAERAALSASIDRYEAAVRGGDGAAMVDSAMPPRLLAQIAAENGATPAVLKETIAAQFSALKAEGIAETVTMDGAAARFSSLLDGEPYALVPSHVVVEGPRHVDSRGQILGLLDGSRWYLIDVTTPARVATFVKAFPAFAGIDLGSKTLEVKP